VGEKLMNHALIFSSRQNYWERASGAHRIATYLRQHGMDIEVVDFAAHWELEILKEFTRKSVKKTTLFFGFSIFFSYWNQTLSKFSLWLKTEYPHIKTIAGGQSILQSDLTNIDIWVDSYGEEAILALAKSLAGNSTAGIKFSADHFGSKKVIKALGSYPAYNLKDYSCIMQARDFLEPWEWATIEFSRGCKFSCAFCNFPVLGVKEDTSRSKESFEYEMKYNYDNFGIDRYYVVDETFNDRLEKITKFADVVEKLNFNPFFSGYVRADLLQNDGMVEELARMNFGGQLYGIETFNHASGKIIGKGLDPDKVKKLILDCKDYFKSNNKTYRGTISLIVGLPFDTPEKWVDNQIWIDKNWMTEALLVYPLTIGDSETTNLSKFSQNLKKYGLREIDKKSTVMSRKYQFWIESNVSKTEILWEHDTMNIWQAKEIAETFQKKILFEHPLDSWALSLIELDLKSKVKNLSDHLTATKAQTYPRKHLIPDFIKSYSLKKLN